MKKTAKTTKKVTISNTFYNHYNPHAKTPTHMDKYTFRKLLWKQAFFATRGNYEQACGVVNIALRELRTKGYAIVNQNKFEMFEKSRQIELPIESLNA